MIRAAREALSLIVVAAFCSAVIALAYAAEPFAVSGGY